MSSLRCRRCLLSAGRKLSAAGSLPPAHGDTFRAAQGSSSPHTLPQASAAGQVEVLRGSRFRDDLARAEGESLRDPVVWWT